MGDMDKILEWVNGINRDIEKLNERVDKINHTIINTRYNANLHQDITKFGRQLSDMAIRILTLEEGKDGSSIEGD